MLLADITNIASPISTGWLDYAKTLLVLSGICILALLAIRFWIPKLTQISASTGGQIELLARCSLEPKRSLYIVRAGKSAVLLGTSENGIHFMTTLDPDEVSQNSAFDGHDARQGNRFARLLESLRPGKAGTTS